MSCPATCYYSTVGECDCGVDHAPKAVLAISDTAKCEDCSKRALSPRWPLMYVKVTGHKHYSYDFKCGCGRGIFGKSSEHELVKAWNERMKSEAAR